MNGNHEHPQNLDRRPARPWGRLAIGTAVAAAVLGTGAYAITDRMVDQDQDSVAQEIPPALPAATATETDRSTTSPKPTETKSSKPDKKHQATTPETTEPEPQSAAEPAQPDTADDAKKRITDAREAAEKAGFPVQRALEPKGTIAAATSETTRKLPNGSTLRITTAKGDLSGQRPLLWAADDGKTQGNSRCTQNFRFSQTDPGRLRPTMLMCWRTSAEQSVAVIAVDPEGTPSHQATTKVVDSEWKKLS